MHAFDVATAELLIFDFDGVVLDSARIKAEAFVELFTAYPEDREAIAAINERMHGITRFKQFQAVYAEVLHEPLSDERSAALGRRYSALCDDRVRTCAPIPGAFEFLESNGVPVWVASGTPHDDLVRTVDERGIGAFFAELRGTPATKPEIVAEALAATGATVERTVFVGDAISDYNTALACELAFVGIVAPDLRDPFPKSTITRSDLWDLESAIPEALAQRQALKAVT